MKMDVPSTVAAFLEGEGVSRQDPLTVAFSGGYDSLCLLSSLCSLGFNVKALYVDHGLRSEAELACERRLNESNCRRLGVPLEVVRIPPGQVMRLAKEDGVTLEAAARALRYRILEKEPLVATAHNRDDQVETLMMKLIFGGTLMSLCGIRRRRGKVVRPLLDVSRADIVSYVDSLGLVPSRDSTNDTLFCLRNRVRHLVMDGLDEGVKSTIVRIADDMQALEARCPAIPVSRRGACLVVSRSTLLGAHPLSRLRTLYDIRSGFDQSRLSSHALSRIVTCVESCRSLSERSFHMTVDGDEVRFLPAKAWFCAPLEEGTSLPYGLHLAKSDDEGALRIDGSKLKGRAFVRMDEEGDSIISSSRRILLSSLLSSWRCPYAFVIQDAEGVKAVFASPFGGRDRIDDSLTSASWRSEAGWRVL